MLIKTVNTIHVLNLGRLAYNSALQVQKWFQAKHLTEKSSDQILLLVEHDPVYTLGLRESLDPEQVQKLSSFGAQVIKSDRGGLTTFHGHGQLVAYPIIHLTKWHRLLTLRNYVSLLENVAVHACRSMGIPAKLNNQSISHTGAWANDKKICAIGVHCRRHVTTHGLALNCNVDLKWFEHITPCGIQDKGVTSISNELNGNFTNQLVSEQLLASFEAIFRCSLKEYTGCVEIPGFSQFSDKISCSNS
jgi:lipoyl(octanoyl) transferase